MTAAKPAAPSALAGIRVIELGSLIAGPYVASILAQFGAEVIKVEPPGSGDPLRNWRKMYEGTSLWWYTQSRNKKSITLDLRKSEAQEIVRKLVEDADVLVENFRPGTMEKWGLGWDEISKINPRLVMVRVSGYGQTGPYSTRPGFAAIAESVGGLRHVSGYPDRAPTRSGISLGDSLASLYGVVGALMALHHVRSGSGTGQVVDVALYESVFAVMESLVPEYSVFGFVRERSGASLPGISPSGTYPCKDGQYVIIAGNGDSIFQRLARSMGRLDLADDPRFADNTGRVEHNEMLDAAITEWTRARSVAEVLAVLQGADVPAERIFTAADIATDPQYAARGMLERHTLPDGQPVLVPGIVPRLSVTPGHTDSLGPTLGAHTTEVLQGIGYSEAEISSLRVRGVL